ncbi:oligoendopeptidase F [Oceanobacillus indicireducens]|uniref:Oligopeptidase F n=1 Tax=Oceanobacillus indicireducens TaxID=1004261 RepID=A0A918D328_9BACI|nr:oligoendopeptidase F [Oceanobacillus indicireducens]GGN60547.1 oligoendopeptidase F [Oceanobacillus indicireducens]
MTVHTNRRAERKDVPEEQKWNLADLFPTPQNWKLELDNLEKETEQVTVFRGKITESATTLLQALKALESYREKVVRVATYSNLKVSADGADPANQRDAALTSSVLAKINAKLSFFHSELLELTSDKVQHFLASEPKLKNYEKTLYDALEDKPHTHAPEVEETLAALHEVHSSPHQIYQRAKTADMQFDPITNAEGVELPMSESLYEDRYEFSADTTTRRNAYKSFTKTLDKYKNTFAHLYATEVTKQVTMAKLRKFPSVTDMLLAPQQVTKEMYHNQLDIIGKELAPHMQRYAKLKKEKLGLQELHYCDLKAPLDPSLNPRTTYEEATDIILDALSIMGPEYHEIMKKSIYDRWVDRADNIGKANGAFCSSPYGVHPYILITWTDTMRGAFVLAHEMGHAGHFYLAGKNQSFMNTRPSTYFIEAPSTLNELLLAERLLQETEDVRMKRWVITQLLGTYHHNFITHLLEGELQRRVYDLAEKGVPLTADVLTEQKLDVIKNFWGDSITVDDRVGLTWMRQQHYYMGLYPYTYSAGLTVSTAVAQMIKEEGRPAINRWLDVLKAGGTKKPLDLIKLAGVDMSKPDAIKVTIDYVGSLVDELIASYENE